MAITYLGFNPVDLTTFYVFDSSDNGVVELLITSLNVSSISFWKIMASPESSLLLGVLSERKVFIVGLSWFKFTLILPIFCCYTRN